jgi:hypothetical protein
MFWARKLTKNSNPLIDFFERLTQKSDDGEEEASGESARILEDEKYPKAKRDITAGE